MKKYLVLFLCFFMGLALGGVAGFKISQSLLGSESFKNVEFGQQSFKAKDYMRTVAYLNKAVALDPNSFVAHLSLADAYYSLNNYVLSLEEYEISLQLSREGGESNYIKTKIEELKKKTGK